ncbi:putative zinc-binding metallopeptidase [Chitinophagaceae bacterium LB-8]|uniref:Zinc-binding metallopeptidase n=1 Tax=Paraflavisolibacter caeni TaxID=2982496 RepID=A0A9X2XMR2_9BACT|nr:putative zinc-binding metallopeptidase [Paraflavisolibacter caeni]MCU7547633.1 putative zinc-binding metallopeptidase [Paraflavisolibacter caeni]
MKLINKISAIFCVLLVLASCKKEENLDGPLPDTLGGETWTKGAIDKWLYDSLTKTYNIETKYRWDPWEVQLDKTLVPPDENKVIPVMTAVKRIWIDPYTQETGSDLFIKKYAPKEFILVGSPQYDFGQILLGQAEGGNKIALYTINNFDQSNIIELRRMLHTIEHEFAHILHQNILYPVEYKSISTGYTATWFNISEEEARENGFITAYSMSGPDEDFVEMVSIMLVNGKEVYEEMIASITNPEAQADLRRKEEIVVSYFKQSWNIDFYRLQQRTQNAINKLAGPPPAIEAYFGFEKAYSSSLVSISSPKLLPQSPGFIQVYNQAKLGLKGVGGRELLDSTYMFFSADDTIILAALYRNASRDTLSAAHFVYAITKDGGNVYSFKYVGTNSNGLIIQSGIAPLLNYFSNNKFRIDWYKDPNKDFQLRSVFTPQQDPSAYFVGLLLE